MDLSTITTKTARVDVRKLNPSSKIWLVEQMITGGKTTLDLHEKYGIPMKLLQKYKRKHINGEVCHESAGRPPILSPENKLIF